VDYSPSDREEVFQLRTAVYGESFPEDDWAWKLGSSPLAPARVYLAKRGRATIGLRAFLFREVKVMNEVHSAVLAVDGMVHPDFRRRGIWSALMREGLRRLRSEGIHLAFCIVGAHRHSYPGFCKLGFADVGSIPLLVRPLRLDGFLSKYSRSERLGSSARSVSRLLARGLRRNPAPEPSGVSVERIHAFDDRFDLLWQHASRQHGVALVRDQKYLNHRYRDRPGEKYVSFAACRGDHLEGYIVLRRKLPMFGLSLGLIMDVMTTAGTDIATHLVLEASRYLAGQEIDAIGCLTAKRSPHYRVLRRAGFLPVPSRFNRRSYHLVVESDPSRVPGIVATDLDDWHLTWGDSDIA
jgi:GNAT superfamily N-acetyltransferase